MYEIKCTAVTTQIQSEEQSLHQLHTDICSINKKKKSYLEIIIFYCSAQEHSHCIPLLCHSIIPQHINGTNTISLPLLLLVIHVVGACRNPSHGALILFVLAEQIYPKRQVAVLEKHFIYSLNRQDRQRVGEEITR